METKAETKQQEKRQLTFKQLLLIVAVIFIALIFVILLFFTDNKQESVYKETATEYGELSVGIEKSSSIDMETVTQSFELDISALVKNESSSSQSSTQQSGSMPMGQGGGMPPGMGTGSTGAGGFQFSIPAQSGLSYSSQAAEIKVEQVEVAVGQKVEKGDLLLKLTKESVDKIYNQLEEDLAEAKQDLDSIENNQKSSRLEAEHNYESNILYGKYAGTEYEETVALVRKELQTAEENEAALMEEVVSLEEELAFVKQNYQEAVAYANNITATLEEMDVYNDPAWYASLEGTRISAQEHVYSLEEQIRLLEEELESAKIKQQEAIETKKAAQRSLEETELSAKWEHDLRVLAYNTARESYDISIAYLDLDSLTQRKAYESAKEKVDSFNDAISDYGIYAQNSGIITELAISAGDSIATGSELVTMYTENISMTVSVEESEAQEITEDSTVYINILPYPDIVFEGKVSDIGEAQYDSNTGINYYDITVSVISDGKEFYQDMTGSVTFITKEKKEVLYVSNRAVIRDGDKSYVQQWDKNGKIVRKEVETGFSDGVSVEIIKGLEEGEVVLIESKVTAE